MALVAANVQIGVTGSVFYAPQGTTVPTTTSGALASGFNEVGYISEDGITETTSTDTNDIIAWQNGDLVRRVQTSHDFTLQFTMLETNEHSLKLYYNDYTHGAGASVDGVVKVSGTQGYRGAFVLMVVDGTELVRIVLPDAQVTERGDVQYVNGDATSYQVTITAYPDASGYKAYKYYATDGAS
jgi:hypothetical protein